MVDSRHNIPSILFIAQNLNCALRDSGEMIPYRVSSVGLCEVDGVEWVVFGVRLGK